jgi:2-keto-4-pentenoate hydratase/2-oxohepta-3-ene-1,7-dioic acid hydratase in catechol pathway
MRLVTFDADGAPRVGIPVDGGVADTGYADMIELIRGGQAALEQAARAAEDRETILEPRLLAPIPRPGKILCAGVNYASHKEENPDAVMPEDPFFFSKLPTAVIGPGEPIVIPSEETKADWEVELAFVIGRRAQRVSEAEALGHVFGWTVLHDVSARDIQFRDNQITLGKGVDTFSPLGPEIVTADELGDWSTLRLASSVNGEQKQSAVAGDMLFSPARLIEFLSALVTLEPGDVVTTGTPAGVGCFRDPPVYLQPGDEVTVEVDRIGRLTNPVEAGW